jgi:hypothetical protein
MSRRSNCSSEGKGPAPWDGLIAHIATASKDRGVRGTTADSALPTSPVGASVVAASADVSGGSVGELVEELVDASA